MEVNPVNLEDMAANDQEALLYCNRMKLEIGIKA
jgi:hypothetical protein